MMEKRRVPILGLVLAVLALLPVLAFSFGETGPASLFDEFSKADSTEKEKSGIWARAILDSMTLEEKVGQLFMVAAYSNKDEKHNKFIENLVVKEKIGGLIFMQGGPGRQVKLINRFQQKAKIPLLMAQDSEWGLSMRLDSTLRFPKNMTLGAIKDSMPLFELGMEIGRQCRDVGIQVNFAPVVDVNNNPRNPVINDRSYGENRHNVAVKGLYFYKGMEFSNCVGTAKHFPGHGDTDTDSHLDLPVIDHPRQRLDSLELYPFRYMFDRGVAGVMVAHLYIPALDTTQNVASTLSPKIVTDLLKNEMGFKGLIFTDALGMRGVTKFWADGETDLKAFLAGNDVLLFSKDVPKAKEMILEAINNGEVTEKELDRRVMKILVTKEWAGLHRNKISSSPQQANLVSEDAVALKKRLFQQAITVVKNENELLPLRNLSQRKIAVVQIGSNASAPFFTTLQKYTSMTRFTLAKDANSTTRAGLLAKLKPYNTVIVGVDKMSKRASKNFGISVSTKAFMKALKGQGPEVVAVLFGSPYALKNFGQSEDAIMVAYENQAFAKEAAAEAIMGAIHVDGILPVTASDQFSEGTTIELPRLPRFQFSNPEGAGMDGSILQGIDNIAHAAIKSGATPGCAILVMRKDKIVFEKGYGRTEYGKAGTAIDPYHTIYDLASVTKIAATTISTMKLVHEGKISLDEHVSAYLGDFRGKGLTHIRVRNLLNHNAGFRSWIPFYTSTFDSTGALRSDLYASTESEEFSVKVLDGMWITPHYKDTIWHKITNSNVRTNGKVRYSDLSMMVMQRVIESVVGQDLDAYVGATFYQPMGMNNTAFQPSENLPGCTFPPTEKDNYWRKKKVQGYVHDQGCAMLGGVSGHAGLFSNVYDIAKVLLMVKSGGRYGELNFFPQELVKQFTAKQLTSSRKGLGWDKAQMDSNKSNPCSQYSSDLTYGHTGFTGIGAWVDPKYDLVFIFLSNRTYPTAENKKLIRQNVRSQIFDVIYESIFAYENRGKGA